MDWFIVAPGSQGGRATWLEPFVPAPHGDFIAIHGEYGHDRSRPVTDAAGWGDYWRHASSAWSAIRKHRAPSGVITLFPQLALMMGLRKRLSGSTRPLVAWTFNLGRLPAGARRRVARFALRAVDRFIVHSRAEIVSYSAWLDLPPERFAFVPFQRFVPTAELTEDLDRPFILSMGSAQRDYRLLIPVLGELGYPAIVVAGAHALRGIPIPANVEVRSGLSSQQCNELLQRARLNVIPVANSVTASGQVTLIDAMMYGRPVIMTRCPASVDYVTDRQDCWLVEPGDGADLKESIRVLWADAPKRAAMGQAARANAVANFSDEAIGKALGAILREVEVER